ncbi:hypothetical protein NNJEOMEG_00085 [Fundidesulfovibrio magnetotacticus]|uniref:Uncharacterized protein n=1 Tax=Fundidesulfovibrio magnetotacticus TaxID=2730080 RepID=A0A6V8LHS8_9BACT|nr:hypothetical protein [Fundidesulfovibrio magnetotacticus]GFK92263.1 hypothetical protein NNJEOMEG_00085 [Fundidesulfovibrio magnetotacticus]
MNDMHIWDRLGSAAAVALCWTLLAALTVGEALDALRACAHAHRSPH